MTEQQITATGYSHPIMLNKFLMSHHSKNSQKRSMSVMVESKKEVKSRRLHQIISGS